MDAALICNPNKTPFSQPARSKDAFRPATALPPRGGKKQGRIYQR
jgi:hypothetical protein